MLAMSRIKDIYQEYFCKENMNKEYASLFIQIGSSIRTLL